MAMGILTFDWGQISYNGSPLATPWWASANVGATILLFYWFLVPILYVGPSLISHFFPQFDHTRVVQQCLVQRLLAYGVLAFF
jgi:OPT oligopeptide transporter protein